MIKSRSPGSHSTFLFPLHLCENQMHSVQSLLPTILLFLYFASVPSFSSNYRYASCAPSLYTCGSKNLSINYPFRIDGRPDFCGHPGYYISCSKMNSAMMITVNDKGYQVIDVDYLNHLITVVDQLFLAQPCPQPYENTSIDSSLYSCSDRDRNVTLLVNCSVLAPMPADVGELVCALGASGKHWYYKVKNAVNGELVGRCNSTVMVPVRQTAADELASRKLSFSEAVREGFSVKWTAGEGWCSDCVNSGGRCGFEGLTPTGRACYCPYGPADGTCSSKAKGRGARKKIKVVVIGTLAAACVLVLSCISLILYRHKKKKKFSFSSRLQSQNASFKISTKDPELGSAHIQTHLFSYDELHEATNCFNASNELGDGAFGIVYKGKLQDGRTIAVKRLYENNCKRLEQFMNEIDILSRLQHPNLVNLYGCSSPLSQSLLLVYEFVPNGTVADHLHGLRAKERILTWAMRLNIAIETADALAYLHSINPPIIHRDVKTCNILLDSSFDVKVADFGLSRLIPTDAMHVSTAPQGTPGYLDPEYHRWYQLTDKSDVYSFGVVLLELISSKPAIDMSRNRSDINLANMAITRIQNGELEQLVDTSLGYISDQTIRKMMTMVAEVAFRCLQSDGDMRPPIKEVLEALRVIEGEWHKVGSERSDSTQNQADCELLKHTSPSSPDCVMKWASRTTTPNTSE